MEFTCKRTEKGWEGKAEEDGQECALLTLEKVGICLMVHNVIPLWTPRTARLYHQVFDLVKQGAKVAGYKFIITGNSFSCDLPKREKFWRMMGFTIFTETEDNGRRLRAAGMRL